MPWDRGSSSRMCRKCGTVAVCSISSAHPTGHQPVLPLRAEESPSLLRDEEYRCPASLASMSQLDMLPRTEKVRRQASGRRRVIKRLPSFLFCSAIGLSGASIVASASVHTSRDDREGGLFQWVEYDGNENENFDWTNMSLPYDKRDLDQREVPGCAQRTNKDECNAQVNCWWGGDDGLGTCIDLTPPLTQDQWDSPSPSIAVTPSFTGICSEQTNNQDCRVLSNCLWSGSCFERTVLNTGVPMQAPTDTPSRVYTNGPITDPPTGKPTLSPIVSPTTESPTRKPTFPPTVSPTTGSPTTSQPATDEPTAEPSLSPIKRPTEEPSLSPSKRPTEEPSLSPSKRPTPTPSKAPSWTPTYVPTTGMPTGEPSNFPSMPPSETPSTSPTACKSLSWPSSCSRESTISP